MQQKLMSDKKKILDEGGSKFAKYYVLTTCM